MRLEKRKNVIFNKIFINNPLAEQVKNKYYD